MQAMIQSVSISIYWALRITNPGMERIATATVHMWQVLSEEKRTAQPGKPTCIACVSCSVTEVQRGVLFWTG